jgi:hypothetical protein
MTVIDLTLLRDSTIAPLTVQYDESTSNMLLPKIASSFLPAFIVVEFLIGGTSLPVAPPNTSVSVPIFRISPRAFDSKTDEEGAYAFLPELAKSVRSLYRRSGLTWDELAYIFGVSRRTLYNWSTGGKVSSLHAQAISSVIRAIHQIDAGSPQLTRSKLLAPAEDGMTFYSRLAQQQSRPPAIGGPAYRPDELLGTTPDSPDPTGPLVDFEQLT